MKYKKIVIWALIILGMGAVYFAFSPIIYPDSSAYYKMATIFDGRVPFSEWKIIRGPGFPAVLYLIMKLFGDNPNGFLLGSYLSYIFLLVFLYKILKLTLYESATKVTKFIVNVLFIVFICINSLIFGYYHTMLTEFITPTLIVMFTYFVMKWTFLPSFGKLKSHVMYTLLFMFFVVLNWFIKQPYLPVFIAILGIAVLLSIIGDHKLENIIKKTSTLLSCIIIIPISIMLWDGFLESKGVDTKTSSSTSSYLNIGLVEGLSNFRRIIDEYSYKKEFIAECEYLTKEEKEKIYSIIDGENDEYSHFTIYDIYSVRNRKIDQTVLFLENKDYSLKDSLGFIVDSFVSHPISAVDSYVSNYLTMINVFAYNFYPDDSIYSGDPYYPWKKLGVASGENTYIGTAIYRREKNHWWPWPNASVDYMPEYEQYNNPPKVLLEIFNLPAQMHADLFILLLFVSPFLGIYYLFVYIKNRKSLSNNKLKMRTLELIIIFFNSATLHILFHAVTCAIIDRYAFVIYPGVLLGYLLLIPLYFDDTKKKRKPSLESGNKTIVVIPAYNEEENIEKVILDIKEHIKGADIVVVNDSSTDNTPLIAEKSGAMVVTTPFNFKYGMALQTGIKYAFENDYDYVIQFDGDGQHLASEAAKMIAKMKETKSDIVIGSRFLVKTDYPHPFFRKLGTKIFSLTIEGFLDQKITDPTSGFQCLSKDVIAKYAEMGKFPEFPDANLIIEMILEGYEVNEVGVQMRSRENGESMHGGIIKPIKYMIKVSYSIVIILLQNIKFRRLK